MLYYLHCFKHKQERESLTGTFVLFIRLVKFNVLFLIKSAFHTQDLTVQEKKYARKTQSSPGTRYHVYKAYSTLTPSIFSLQMQYRNVLFWQQKYLTIIMAPGQISTVSFSGVSNINTVQAWSITSLSVSS